MLTLFHHPFCPHSRFIRLALAEHGLEHRTIEERVWERRQEFLMLNPACTTPVLMDEGYPPVPGAAIIAEYLDETRGPELRRARLLPRELGRASRSAACRLVQREVLRRGLRPAVHGAPLQAPYAGEQGGGSPDTEVIRAARTTSATISPISDGWCAPAIGWPASA